MARVTPRQRQVLLTIDAYTSQRGVAPTIREMGNALGITSTNGVVDHLRVLESKGLINRNRYEKRSVTLTDSGREVLRDW